MKPLPERIILASASPRRRFLLQKAGIRFKVIPSHVSESHPKNLKPAHIVTFLAVKKAIAISKRFPSDVVLGADTLVFLKGKVIGKPRNSQHAARILQELSGSWQRVYTGVAVVWNGGRRIKKGAAVSHVKFRTLSPSDIAKAAQKHLDKAGAYSIQAKGDDFVTELRGDYDNVVGLPVRLVQKLLRSLPPDSWRNGRTQSRL